MSHKLRFSFAWIFISACLLIFPTQIFSKTILVAVSSNFTETLSQIVHDFENKTGEKIQFISGSSGKLFAQIINGAPFDLFLSADEVYPERLEKEFAQSSYVSFIYAFGKLALYSIKPLEEEPNVVLNKYLSSGLKLAIAQPSIAPYGQAAMRYLESENLADKFQSRFVYGENIGQVFAYVASGNAELGFVALSQVINRLEAKNRFIELPLMIPQKAIQLNESADDFIMFLKSSKERLKEYGYGSPE